MEKFSICLAFSLFLACSGVAAVPTESSEVIVNPLVQQSLNYYGILLPPDYNDPAKANTTYPLCVLLQGSGNREDEYLELVTTNFKREGVIYLMPRAPYLHYAETLKQQKPVYTAWPEYTNDGSTFKVDKDLQPKDVVIEKLYTDWIAKCVEDAKARYRIRSGKVAVFGHSQGAAFGFCLAADHPELIKACFLAEGYYKSRLQDDSAAKALKDNGIHLTIIHNEDDPVVGFADATALVSYLEKNQVPFDHTFYPHGKHDISEPCKQQAAAFVDTWCRNGK